MTHILTDLLSAESGPPATPVERLRAELAETLEGVVDVAFDPLRGTQERRDQLAQLISRAQSPQARCILEPCLPPAGQPFQPCCRTSCLFVLRTGAILRLPLTCGCIASLDAGSFAIHVCARSRAACMQEFMAALVVLDTLIKAEYLKPFWGCWAYPAPSPTETGAATANIFEIALLREWSFCLLCHFEPCRLPGAMLCQQQRLLPPQPVL